MLFVVLLLFRCLPLAAAPEHYEGRLIAEILFEPAGQPIPEPELYRLLPMEAGQPLRMNAVRDAIKRLYATGRYAEIAVDARLQDGAVVLEFVTKNTWFIGRVSVDGVPEPPNKGQLENATKLQLGTEFTEERLQEGIENLRKLLRANGFHQAKIERAVEYHPLTGDVDILFLVEPGERARFTRPAIEGDLERPENKVIGATGWKRLWGLLGWKTATESRVQDGLEKVRRSYQKEDYLMSRVSLESMDFVPEENRVRPKLKIEAGPKVTIKTTGAKVSEGTLRELVPIYQEQSVDRDLLVEGMRNLTEHFQNEGYFDARVDFQTPEVNGDQEVIEYEIDRGERYKLVHLEISGNRYFDEETIRERMSVTPATLLRYRRGRFSEELLDNDLDSISNLYRTNGFREVQVTSRIDNNYQGHARDVAVFIDIDEGPQWFVSELDIRGVDLRLIPDIESLLQSMEGQPYSELNVASDRDNILNYYYNNGYPAAAFEWSATPAEDPYRMNVRYVIDEGRRHFVRRVLVGGLESTSPEMVYDRIPLEHGDPLSQSRMIDSQRRLYDLGIFAKVDTAVQNPDGLERNKYVLYQFEEARKYSVSGGVGAEIARIGGGQTNFDAPAGTPGFSPRISLGLSRTNLFGIGHTGTISTRLSNIQRRVLFSYLAPQFKNNEDVNLTFTSLYDVSRDIRTFTSRRVEGAAQIGQRLSRANSMQYRVAFRRVNVDEGTLKISPELIPVFAQPVRVGVISGTFIQDRRDDPIESTRGQYNTVDLALASKIFASQTDYVRLLARNSTYHRVGKEMIFARTVTFGWITNIDSDDGRNEIPLPERFFAGGAVSHRGFPDNQAGPRDLTTGFPLGGKALFMHGLELRFPLIGDTIGGVLFHDAGNVYSSLNDFSLRVRQRNLEDFDYMVHAVGFGVRYRTPVGPLRLDFGFVPNSPRFFGFRGTREQLLTGTGELVTQRMSQFQFHFSLGQSF